MASVYERGLFTVSSNLPGEDMPEWQPRNHVNANSQGWLEKILLEGPLATRAWCLQERYLSPVLLHVLNQKILDMGVQRSCSSL